MHQVESIHFYSILQDKQSNYNQTSCSTTGTGNFIAVIFTLWTAQTLFSILLYVCHLSAEEETYKQEKRKKNQQRKAPKFFSLKIQTPLARCAQVTILHLICLAFPFPIRFWRHFLLSLNELLLVRDYLYR